MSRLIVKVGGRVAEASARPILELASENEVCVVHGAGPQISLEMERAGIPVEFVGGRRVTTLAGLQIVRQSMEAVNASLCESIGDRAVPIFGNELGFEAVRWAEELGFVGEPFAQEIPGLSRMLEARKIPVVAPLARDADEPIYTLNVNADDASTAIAVGMQADRLLFLTDVEGFMVGGEVVDSLDVATGEALIQGETLDPTILPKLEAAMEAARRGVSAFIGRTEVRAEPQAPGVPARYLGRLE
jgi:acetylglutamate kinase